MEKLKKIPKNHVRKVQFEASIEHNPLIRASGSFIRYGDCDMYGREIEMPIKHFANVELIVEIEDKEDVKFVEGLQAEGIKYASKNPELDIEKFRYVINEGFCRLPILLKHSDPEIAKIAWIFSKYFSQRNDLMPERVVE